MANNLWTAFIAHNGSNAILAASSPDGVTWSPSGPVNQTSPFTPSLAYFNDRLYLAFITDDKDSATGVPSNRIFLCHTTDGVTWSEATFFNQYSKFAPSLAVWNGSLHIAFVANNASNTLLVYHSSNPDDATSWSATVATNQWSPAAPALAAYGPAGQTGELYLAYVANNGSQDIFVTSLSANQPWSTGKPTGQSCHFSPALAGGTSLYLVFAAANGSKDLLLSSLTASGGWAPAVSMNQSTSAAPGAAIFGTGLSAGFNANNSSGEVLLVSNGTPATNWPTANVDVKQQSATGPAIAVAPLSYDPVMPGPSAANNNYMITNHNIADPLQNITVTVVALQDLVNTGTYAGQHYQPVGSALNPGFSWQLNCQPPGTINDPATGKPPAPGQPNYTGPYPAAGHAVWEQFGITVQGTQVFVWFDNASSAGVPNETRSPNALFSLPTANTIPKGYRIEIKLVTDPSTNNVTNVSVNAWDAGGHAIKGGISGSPVNGPWLWPVTAFLAPILNLQFNIGGPDNGQYAKFSADTPFLPILPILNVSYKADSPLMVRAATNLETAENSNLSFGLLAEYPSNPIVQACSGT